MAALSSILIICTVFDAAAVSVVTHDKAAPSVVRREADGEHHIKLDAKGHAQARPAHLLQDQSFLQDKPKAKELTECDLQFLMMDEGTDECVGDHHPEEVNDPGMCEEAATRLGLTKMSDTAECTASLASVPVESCNYWEQFTQTTHKLAVLPVPKGCYHNVTTGKVYYNPTASNTTGVTLTGKKICKRSLYVNGTTDSQPTGDAAGCVEGTSPILNYDDCLAASLCTDGGGACKIEMFKDNVTTFNSSTRPMGCYVDFERCWGFNHFIAEADTTWGAINGTPVCKEATPAGSAITESVNADGADGTTATTAAPAAA